MSKRLFLKKFFLNNKETGSIISSSNILAKKMVKAIDVEDANIIVELGAGGGIFTKYIFKYSELNKDIKQIFIIEKDKDFYNLLIEKFPDNRESIYNIDVLELDNLLKEKNINHIDLMISGLPFKSLDKSVLEYLINAIFTKYLTKKSKFIQFSYFKNFYLELDSYFNKITTSKCFFNIPSAYIFECNGIKNEK